jgi:anti-anti-sigma regulatory factor
VVEAENSFSYQICGSSAVVIVNLTGILSSESIETIQALQGTLVANTDLKSVILNFSEIHSLSQDAIPSIAQLQKAVRDRRVELRMCSMKISVKEKLGKAGILRNNEICEDSKAAIYSLTVLKAKSA